MPTDRPKVGSLVDISVRASAISSWKSSEACRKRSLTSWPIERPSVPLYLWAISVPLRDAGPGLVLRRQHWDFPSRFIGRRAIAKCLALAAAAPPCCRLDQPRGQEADAHRNTENDRRLTTRIRFDVGDDLVDRVLLEIPRCALDRSGGFVHVVADYA